MADKLPTPSAASAAKTKARKAPRAKSKASTSRELVVTGSPKPPVSDISSAPPPLTEAPTVSEGMADIIDRSTHAYVARLTGGLSPTALLGAYLDWASHLAFSPGRQLHLLEKGTRKATRLANSISRSLSDGASTNCIEPLPQDRRFSAPGWRQWPFDLISQSFLLQQQWWHNATTGVPGVTAQHEKIVEFASRQLLDMAAPSNFALTNPEVLKRTYERGGENLIDGFRNFLADWERSSGGRKPVGSEAFEVGRNVAISPGKVIYRNALIELIQYEPTTEKVRAEPILIVPAWIMKYYILDLSSSNSMVRYLVEQGYTVFMISWKNPDASDRDRTMEDYRRLGIMAALDAISAVAPQEQVHAVGYCLGGTLLSIAAATMARDSDERLKSITLFAAQTDFSEPGELALFINESQLGFLDDVMWQQGYLDARQMAGAFEILRSNDLVWSRIIHDYLMGERRPMNDLMAWNADSTRMPYRMHSEYLHKLFLDNELAAGRYHTDGRPVAISDIRVPIFAVGAELDHVAPWHSVYKINLLADTDITFLLASGGHNAGIVSEPGKSGRSYRIHTKARDDFYVDPDRWTLTVPKQDGSWWPAWVEWLDAHSGRMVPARSTGNAQAGYPPLAEAPGDYVRMA